MKNFIFSIHSEHVKISVRPVFNGAKSFPEFFFYVWDHEIIIQNKTNKPLAISDMDWRAVDVIGRDVALENSFEDDAISPHDQLQFTKSTSLSAPAAIILGKVSIHVDHETTHLIKMPTIALDSPFHDFVCH
ncbi:MAG: Protein ApaG [Holosporales bacterium]